MNVKIENGKDELKELDGGLTKENVHAFFATTAAFKEIRDRQLYRHRHATFGEFLETDYKIRESQMNEFIGMLEQLSQ